MEDRAAPLRAGSVSVRSGDTNGNWRDMMKTTGGLPRTGWEK